MTLLRLTRRSALMLPLALAACGGEDDNQTYAPLSWDYLPPLKLNVASIAIEQRFVASGRGNDVSNLAPVPPVVALRTMGEQRLRALGGSGRAVMAITDATLARNGDTISGSMAVVLTLYNEGGEQVGFVEARVSQRYAGRASSLRGKLYEMVKTMVDSMNVELEFQIRRNLRDWITEATAANTAVEQTPLANPLGGRPGGYR